MSERNTLFSYRKDTLPTSGMLDGKPQLFEKLAQRDVKAYVTHNAETAFDGQEVNVSELTDDRTTREAGKILLDQVGAIVNRLDRSFDYSKLSETSVAEVPKFNENAMRSLAFRKHRMHEEVLKPLGLGMPTELIASPVQATLFMEQNPAERYIVKPTSGTFSEGVQSLQPAEVIDFFAQQQQLDFILQPMYDLKGALPAEIKPYDAMSSDGFETWSRARVPKELRMYSFYSDGVLDIFPVGRAIHEGTDQWFFVDPESIPQTLYGETDAAVRRAVHLTGSRAVYAALDTAYGTLNDEEPAFHVVELNAKAPYLIGYDKHAQVADTIRETYANHIQRVVENTVQ